VILIDALNVESLGGVLLLEYLCKELHFTGRSYHVLLHKNSVHVGRFKDHVSAVSFKSFIISRKTILDRFIKDYKPNCLLCFGNFPPPRLRFSGPIITPFQNIFLASDRYDHTLYTKNLVIAKLKRAYLRNNQNNTDFWIVPTNHVKQELMSFHGIADRAIKVIPFYDDSLFNLDLYSSQNKDPNRLVYVSSPSEHKNHIRLLDAWNLVKHENRDLRLRILTNTLDKRWIKILSKTTLRNFDSVELINTAEILSYKESMRLQAECSTTIYPTLAETFGYGTIESCAIGNSLLLSDLACFDEVVQASYRFDPQNVEAIKRAILQPLALLDKPRLLFLNRVSELITLLK